MNNVQLQSPWVSYANGVKELFGKDPDVTIKWSEDSLTLQLFVNNNAKAEAISKILPVEKKFGNVTLNIEVVPPDEENINYATVLKDAFYGNPVFKDVYSVSPIPGGVTFNYAVFNKQIIQFYNDNMSDINGNRTTLAEDLAREILEVDGIMFCTDNVDPN